MTQGILFGIGAALCFNSTCSLPSQYFKKKRGLATGVVFGAGGIGAAVISLALGSTLR